MSHELQEKSAFSQVENAAFEKGSAADFKADAIAAENAEHNMTVLEAVRAYPMASFWAFVRDNNVPRK
jgi:hypothetical protein